MMYVLGPAFNVLIAWHYAHRRRKGKRMESGLQAGAEIVQLSPNLPRTAQDRNTMPGKA